MIEQSAPTTQTGTATATSHQSGATNAGKHGGAQQTNTSKSTATAGGTNDASQSAQQAQSGGGSQTQVVEQSAPSGGDIDTRADQKQPIATTPKASWIEAVAPGVAAESRPTLPSSPPTSRAGSRAGRGRAARPAPLRRLGRQDARVHTRRRTSASRSHRSRPHRSAQHRRAQASARCGCSRLY